MGGCLVDWLLGGKVGVGGCWFGLLVNGWVVIGWLVGVGRLVMNGWVDGLVGWSVDGLLVGR